MSMPTSLVAFVLAGAVYAPDVPVTVSQLVTGAPSHVRLTNTSRQAVTAWSLATTAVSGDRTHREVYTADGYLSEVTHGCPAHRISWSACCRASRARCRSIPFRRARPWKSSPPCSTTAPLSGRDGDRGDLRQARQGAGRIARRGRRVQRCAAHRARRGRARRIERTIDGARAARGIDPVPRRAGAVQTYEGRGGADQSTRHCAATPTSSPASTSSP